MTKKPTEIVSEIVELLAPMDPTERARVIQASLTLLGDDLPVRQASPEAKGAISGEGGGLEGLTLPPRAVTWIKQYGLTLDELQQVFHLGDGNAEFIGGEVPGKNKKEKTFSAYVLTGLSQLLSSGSVAFDDKAARALCESSGCYDLANHSVYVKERGNEFTGTKEKGWSLTAPGLKRAAALVKEMTKS